VTTNVSQRIFLLQENRRTQIKSKALVVAALCRSLAGAVQAQDMEAVYRRIHQLENEVQQLRARVGNLGPVSAPREVRIDPVFIGSASANPNSGILA
jgi:hypothetical protein